VTNIRPTKNKNLETLDEQDCTSVNTKTCKQVASTSPSSSPPPPKHSSHSRSGGLLYDFETTAISARLALPTGARNIARLPARGGFGAGGDASEALVRAASAGAALAVAQEVAGTTADAVDDDGVGGVAEAEVGEVGTRRTAEADGGVGAEEAPPCSRSARRRPCPSGSIGLCLGWRNRRPQGSICCRRSRQCRWDSTGWWSCCCTRCRRGSSSRRSNMVNHQRIQARRPDRFPTRTAGRRGRNTGEWNVSLEDSFQR
jgi:hypothetical protein